MATKFNIAGTPTNENLPEGLENFNVRAQFNLFSSSLRSDDNSYEHLSEEDEVARIEFEDGTFWMCSADELDVFVDIDKFRNENKGVLLASDMFKSDEHRGWISKVVAKAIKFLVPSKRNIVDVGVKALALQVDRSRQSETGLFKVGADFSLTKVEQELSTQNPILLFLHGTCSNFNGSFGGILEKQSGGLWEYIQEKYQGNVYAYQHYTLTHSPFENVVELMEYMPSEIDLNIISYSRGGLIGELVSLYHQSSEMNGRGYFSELEDQFNDVINAYSSGNEDLAKKFNDAFEDKVVRIKNHVRVACPAAGTTLVSSRLDAYFNVILNLVEKASGPLAPLVKTVNELVGAILATKNNPVVLPGIEAMNPTSEFQKYLNSPVQEILAPLAVVAGNSRFDLSVKGFVNALTKLFYWRENDYVVDTASMLMGVPRANKVPIYLDNEVDTHHFKYFEHHRTQSAIKNALSEPSSSCPSGFIYLNQKEENRGLIMGNLKPPAKDEIKKGKPIIFILPGILGSNLERDGSQIYLKFDKIALGQMKKLRMGQPNVKATSVVGSHYRKFTRFMRLTHEVIPFPFDWRLSLSDEVDRLKEWVEFCLDLNEHQPVSIVAHSMGGVLARQFVIDATETWQKIKDRKGYKLLFLGSPLGGSYAIPEVLTGLGKRIRQLSSLDRFNSEKDLLSWFSQYKGILELLPLNHSDWDFSDHATWLKLKQNFNEFDWTIPSDKDLLDFKDFAKKALAVSSDLYNDPNVIYIAGKDDKTPETISSKTNDRLQFQYTKRGDGSVTWDSGIPSELIEGGRVYYTNVQHGALLKKKELFNGIKDLLETGFTNEFSTSEPTESTRGFSVSENVQNPGHFDVGGYTSINDVINVLMGDYEAGGLEKLIPSKVNTSEIEVSLQWGHLKYASYPIVAGHLQNDGIYAAEKAVDNFLNNTLLEQYKIGDYPESIGTSRVFQKNGESLAIILGLGLVDRMSPSRLEQSVKKAVASYLRGLHGSENANSKVGLSFLFIGSGYVGLSLQSSIISIIEGCNKANRLMIDLGKHETQLTNLEFLELYDDKATLALNILQTLSEFGNNFDLNFRWRSENFNTRAGAKKRLNINDKPDWVRRISVIDPDYSSHQSRENNSLRKLRFTSSSGTARAEVYDHTVNFQNIQSLIAKASKNMMWSHRTAKTLYEVLIPADFKAEFQLKQKTSLLLDKQAATFPWELIHDSAEKSKPFATETGVIRQLKDNDFVNNKTWAGGRNVLIVGDPNLDAVEGISQLRGAREEGELVQGLLSANYNTNETYLNASSDEIIEALYNGEYKILHFAGHGVINPENPDDNGIVIGDEERISATEIAQLPFLPELVFVNCCHLGAVIEDESRKDQFYGNRHLFAANVGVELIKQGVKAVIVAGWAVDDSAAKVFATNFYQQMLLGSTFGDAVLFARQICYKDFPHSNTWGAFQCYGEYSFKLDLRKNNLDNEVYDKKFFNRDEILIELDNICSSSEMFGNDSWNLKKIRHINRTIELNGDRFGDTEVYEKLANAYFELGKLKSSFDSFQKMLNNNDAQYKMKSLERYILLIRKMVRSKIDSEDLSVDHIIRGISLLESLQENTVRTAERYYLIGGSYRAKYMLEKMNKGSKADLNSLMESKTAFEKGLKLEPEETGNIIYPLLQIVAVEMAQKLVEPSNSAHTKKIRKCLKMMEDKVDVKSNSNYDFWEYMKHCNFELAKLINNPSADNLQNLTSSMKKVYAEEKLGTRRQWQSEVDFIESLLSLYNNLHVDSSKLSQLNKLVESLDEYLGHVRIALNLSES